MTRVLSQHCGPSRQITLNTSVDSTFFRLYRKLPDPAKPVFLVFCSESAGALCCSSMPAGTTDRVFPASLMLPEASASPNMLTEATFVKGQGKDSQQKSNAMCWHNVDPKQQPVRMQNQQ